MPISLPYLLVFLVALQGLILAGVFLIVPYFQSRANRQLAICFIAVSISGINYALMEGGIITPYLVMSNDIMWEYLFPASLLLYFAHALDHPLSQKKERFYLFLPFLITLVINLIIDFDDEFGWYHLILNDHPHIKEGYYAVEDVGTLIFAVLCCSYSWRIVKHYPPKVKTNWFKSFWWWSTSVIAFWILLWLLLEVIHVDLMGAIYAAVMLLFTWVTYQGVLRFKLAEEKFEIRQILETKPLVPPQEESQNPYFLRLEQLMQQQRLYREPDLSRDTLAQKLGISSGYLSQQLSQEGTSFSAYINQYRISEAKQLLVDPDFQQYSLLAIGYEAGFNSKSTYYAAFKKSTGLSPSAFRENHSKAS